MKQFLIIVLINLLPGLSLAQSFDFKGVVLGARTPISVIEQKLGIKCNRPDGDQACAGNSTMMSLPAKVYVDLLAGSIARMDITFDPLLFDEAAKSLSQRYGQPFRQRASMFVWRNKRGDLVILERNGLLSFSSIEQQRKTDEAVREMKKDF